MALDLTSLTKAITALETSIGVYAAVKHSATEPDPLRDTLRAGVIQHFEVAYERSWKFMKRWLEEQFGAAVADGVTRRELFRLAAENRLIDDVDAWMHFHFQRNETSHTYDADTAGDVSSVAPEFLRASCALLAAIAARND
jgi:nucleotidyltransferase substrate binding protein (TIGR01987 family)